MRKLVVTDKSGKLNGVLTIDGNIVRITGDTRLRKLANEPMLLRSGTTGVIDSIRVRVVKPGHGGYPEALIDFIEWETPFLVQR